MQDWVSFAATCFFVFGFLALCLPRRHVLLLGIAALAGIVAFVLVEWLVSPRDVWNTFLVTAVPALCVVSAILGYVWPRKAWQWGLTPFLALAIWQVLGPYSNVKWGNLGPIPYVFPFYTAVLLAIPAIIAAEVAAYIARRRQKTPFSG
jgi:hypothetical protein